MQIKEKAHREQAKKIADEGGEPEVRIKAKPTTRMLLDIATTPRMARGRVINLGSEEEGKSTGRADEDLFTARYGAKSITKKSEQDEVVKKPLSEDGEEHEYSRGRRPPFRTPVRATMASRTIKTEVKVKAKGAMILERDSSERDSSEAEKMIDLPMLKDLATPQYATQDTTKTSIKAGKKLMPQQPGKEHWMYATEQAMLADQIAKRKKMAMANGLDVITDLSTDENDTIPTLSPPKYVTGWGHTADNIMEESDSMKAKERLVVQQKERRERATRLSLYHARMLGKDTYVKGETKEKSQGLSKLVTLKYSSGTQDVDPMTKPSLEPGESNAEEDSDSQDENIETQTPLAKRSYKTDIITEETRPLLEAEIAAIKILKQAIEAESMMSEEEKVYNARRKDVLRVGGTTIYYGKRKVVLPSDQTKSITEDLLTNNNLPSTAPPSSPALMDDPQYKKMPAFPAEELAEQDRLADEAAEREAERWCGGGWVVLGEREIVGAD